MARRSPTLSPRTGKKKKSLKYNIRTALLLLLKSAFILLPKFRMSPFPNLG
jgi:hypothetical protein